MLATSIRTHVLMKSICSLLLLPLMALQDDFVRQVRELVQKLGAEEVEERERASQLIYKMDRSVLPILRREMAQTMDKEAKGRIAGLINAMTFTAVYAPHLEVDAKNALKGALEGSEKDSHVVLFTSLP